LIIPTATLLITLALLLGYFFATGDRGVIQSTPIVAQNAPAASSHTPSIPARMPLSNENYAFATIAGSSATVTATASSALSGVSGKNQVGSPNQSALKFPTIYFAANSAEILSSGKPFLRQAARLIKQLPAGASVEISGYTKRIGSPIINMQLSQRRANAVRRALVQAGVDPAMLSAKGYGGSHDLTLASQNGTVEGRSSGVAGDRRRNDRRVEFSIAHQ
jgi:outer membrane protein OmpA-like peptidoglycan-associated protein